MYRVSEGDKEGIIFLNKDELYGDTKTVGQIRSMLSSPAVDHPRIMPDCHFGQGCCVGFTSHLTERVIPNYIGGDIGCGISLYAADARLLKKLEKKPESFLMAIEQTVPVGTASQADKGDVGPVYAMAQRVAIDFAVAYKEKFGIALMEHVPNYDEAWFQALVQRTGVDAGTVMKQIGTLGSGNHFIEVSSGKDVVTDTVDPIAYVAVHSGSRALGQAICQFHQNIITQGNKADWPGYLKASKHANHHHKDASVRAQVDRELRAQYLNPQAHDKFLTGVEAYRYYFDMIFAQCYAQHNRFIMLETMLNAFGVELDPNRVIESVHNYIDFGDLIWRKGAVAAHKDSLVIIALNMREGILIARGLGNAEWNLSTAHGAGRRVPRNEAKNHCTLKEFKIAMKEVYSNSVNEHTLDEAPIMYKDSALIRERMGDTCTVVAHLVPLINVKGY